MRIGESDGCVPELPGWVRAAEVSLLTCRDVAMAATLHVSTSAKPGEPNMTAKKAAPKPNAPGGASKKSKGKAVAAVARAEAQPQKKKTRPSALNAAARVLAETDAAMNC
jgi:hypothetical protein